jgi:hypothetical protein
MKTDEPHIPVETLAHRLAEQPEVVVAYLFGSLARGQATPRSDVDVAVLLDAGLGPRELVERQLELAVALDDLSTREVQVVLLNTAPPFLAYQVLREGRLLHERDREERIDFEVRAMKRYFDVKPMLDFYRERLVRELQEGGLGERSERRAARAVEAAERIRRRLAGSPGP